MSMARIKPARPYDPILEPYIIDGRIRADRHEELFPKTATYDELSVQQGVFAILLGEEMPRPRLAAE